MGFGVSACSNLFINHASCIPSLSCLPSFYAIPISYASFFNSQDFNLLVQNGPNGSTKKVECGLQRIIIFTEPTVRTCYCRSSNVPHALGITSQLCHGCLLASLQ